MERYQQACQEALTDLKYADHIINITYKLVKDPKLMLAVLQRLESALTNTVACVLHFERLYKKIPPFAEHFTPMYEIFKARCRKIYHFRAEYVDVIWDVKEILRLHEESPVEFARKGTFVICKDDYRVKTITVENIKEYIRIAKQFQNDVEIMVSKHG